MMKKIAIGVGAFVVVIVVIALIPITGIFNSTSRSPDRNVPTVPVDKVPREH